MPFIASKKKQRLNFTSAGDGERIPDVEHGNAFLLTLQVVFVWAEDALLLAFSPTSLRVRLLELYSGSGCAARPATVEVGGGLAPDPPPSRPSPVTAPTPPHPRSPYSLAWSGQRLNPSAFGQSLAQSFPTALF